MNTDFSITVESESDVEQKILYPLLTDPNYLAIPNESVKTKEYLAPTQLDKAAGRSTGYFPDYSVWMNGHPVLIVEAKDPSTTAQKGFHEACLYARHLNSRYPSGLNPCHFVLASNGSELLAGHWDQEQPVLQLQILALGVGTTAVAQLVSFCGVNALRELMHRSLRSIRMKVGTRPVNLAGGQALLNAKTPLNTFAADLSPVLRRYFSSTNDANNKEIAERAYVSSTETTEYDRVLEALLRDRVTPRRDTIVQTLRTTKREEPALTKALRDYTEADHQGGQLQLIQGAVGSGKSLFARRYRDLLEPADLKPLDLWAFIDFNASPASLKNAETWLCESFLKSFEKENPPLQLYSEPVLKGVFSKQIQQHKTKYDLLRRASEAEELKARAHDLATWQSNPTLFVEGIGQYARGTGKNVVVVMDNVDKMDLQNQLDAFQLSLWFMARSNAFVILQMRDETYERYKNKPPLDTFRSGIAFHISPPRFVDVVKRRLELGIEYLGATAKETQEYILDNNMRVILPKGELSNFLYALYMLIFGRRGNVARILEALAGRDVRKALEMFVSIVTSGHLSTSAITSNVRGAGAIPINEYHIIRILMRTDYRFFSENSGNITNILHYENDWKRPDNFLLSEVLFFLSVNRKHRGELGLEGYFAVRRVCDEIQKKGYERQDVLRATNYLLNRQLIIADNFNFSEVRLDDCVKIQAAGFIHLRVLCERLEYLYGVIPVVPVADERVAAYLADYVNRENQRGDLSGREKVRAVEILHDFLKGELARLRERNPFFDPKTSGAVYVLHSMEQAIRRFWQREDRVGDENQLDLV